MFRTCCLGLTFVWLAPLCTAQGHAAEKTEKVRVLTSGPGAGHYLEWRGRPILLCGDSITQGWMECGDNFDQEAYLDALSSRGINLLMLWSFKATSAAIQRQDDRLGYDAPEIIPWSGSADKRDLNLLEFNPRYFERLRQLVAGAERRGIVVLLTVHDGWPKTCFDGHPFNEALGNGPLRDRRQYVELADYDREQPGPYRATWSAAEKNQHFQERFCDHLIESLRPYSNVVYEMFNEGEWYPRDQRRRHERHFLEFFRRRCTNLLLSNSDHITGDNPQSDPNVDVITWHPRDWIGHFNDFAHAFGQAPAKPYLYSEPVPEFDGRTPSLDSVRRSIWETLLAGAGWVNQNDTSFGWDRQAKIADRSAARDAAYDMAGHAARYFQRPEIHFWQMTPHGELASSGICLARPGVEYIAYAPAGGQLSLRFNHDSGPTLHVSWFNPRTGEYVNRTRPRDQDEISFVAPFPGDAVLHVSVKSP